MNASHRICDIDNFGLAPNEVIGMKSGKMKWNCVKII